MIHTDITTPQNNKSVIYAVTTGSYNRIVEHGVQFYYAAICSGLSSILWSHSQQACHHRRIFQWALRSQATPSFVPQNILYYFWDLIINLKTPFVSFIHVIRNERHIFTVSANFRVCKSQTFFSFCCRWAPGLVEPPFQQR